MPVIQTPCVCSLSLKPYRVSHEQGNELGNVLGAPAKSRGWFRVDGLVGGLAWVARVVGFEELNFLGL